MTLMIVVVNSTVESFSYSTSEIHFNRLHTMEAISRVTKLLQLHQSGRRALEG